MTTGKNKEQFEECRMFPNYKISNLGNVMNKHGRVLENYTNKGKLFDGELIRLYTSPHKRSTALIKRLVADAFIENVDDKNVLIKNLLNPITPDNLVVFGKTRNGR